MIPCTSVLAVHLKAVRGDFGESLYYHVPAMD